ncbi:MAG: hypothetical protein IH598_16830 [Bacteroidales bacterium]|nr:hypothetical protein [Bacteroidales bacterium]
MKKISIILTLFTGIAFSLLSSCEADKNKDICDDTKEQLIEKSFVLSAKVQYQDYEPYQGKVSLSIYKRYCNNNVSGAFNREGNCNEEGYWFTGMQYIYKFENSLDKVEVEFEVFNMHTAESKKVHETFYYIDVLDYNYEVNKTYEFILPWTKEDEGGQ